ncbi:MAG TPA: RnfABCDGE type electron transport complex subunit B [Burkholderiales bacterium]|nr:RnfABCDGE type electron transport complex subunit B [Burkholderiales bacterium]
MARGKTGLPVVAFIDEQTCIGCTLCIQACPVDAIVGAGTLMHTVIAAECTGCKWCLPPCPVDCISMVDAGAPLTREERRRRAAQYKSRYLARRARLRRERLERRVAGRGKTARGKKQAAIERAMQRASQRLGRSSGKT